MGKTILFLVLAGLLGLGCAREAGSTLFVDEAFTADEVRQIQEAADLWEVASGGRAHVDLVFGAHVSKVPTPTRRYLVRLTLADAAASENPDVRGDNIAVTWTNHQTNAWELILVVPERLGSPHVDAPPTTLRETVAHEFGHHLGLQHVADPRALMFNGDLGTDRFVAGLCLGPADVAELGARVDLAGATVRECP